MSLIVPKEKSDTADPNYSEQINYDIPQTTINLPGNDLPPRQFSPKPAHPKDDRWQTITLCGSFQYAKLFYYCTIRLTMTGWKVFGPSTYEYAPKEMGLVQRRAMLNDLHKAKIDASDAIFVVDGDKFLDDYIKNEIEYAKSANKKIYYYSKNDLDGKLECRKAPEKWMQYFVQSHD